MPTLYELGEEWMRLRSLFESGEIDEQTYDDTLSAYLVDATAEKLEGYCKFLRQLQADADALKAEKMFFAAKQKTVENQIDRLKERLQQFLEFSGKSSAPAGKFTVSLCTNGGKIPVVIRDGCQPKDAPDVYQAVTVDWDMEALRADLEAGEEIDFAQLGERGQHVRIR